MLSCVFVFMLLGRNAITHTSAMCPFVVWKRTWSVDCLWFYSQTTVWNSGKRLNAFCDFCTCIQDRSRDFQGVNQWRPLLHEYNVALQYGNLVFMVTFFCWKKGSVFNIASSFKFSENFHQNLSKITKKMFFFFPFIIQGLFNNGGTHMPNTREHVKPPPEQQFTWTLSSWQRPGFVFKDDNPWCRKYGTGNSCYSIRRGSYNNKKENKRPKNRNPRGTGVLVFGILSSDLDFAAAPRLHVRPPGDNLLDKVTTMYW